MILIDEAADLLQRTPSLGPRDPRRGPGPVADDAAGGRPAGQHRLGHRARRPGPGHHAVGHPLLDGIARATSATRRLRSSELVAGFRVPGAVIDFAARLLPPIAPGAHPAALGPPAPRRARPADDTADRPRRGAGGPGRAGRRGHGRGDRRRRGRWPDPRRAGAGRHRATTCWARTPRSSTPESTWSRPRWPRAWSSTTWCCWSPPRSSPASRTRSPGCAGSTSA